MSLQLRVPLPDVVSMQTRQANPEGTGENRLRRLVEEALRMRPSRIVVDEVRQEECLHLSHRTQLPPAATVQRRYSVTQFQPELPPREPLATSAGRWKHAVLEPATGGKCLMDDWAWVPWVIAAVSGATAAFLAVRGQWHTQSAHWLARASREIDGLRAELKSEIVGVRSEVTSARNELVSTRSELGAQISAAKSENLLAVEGAKADAQRATGSLDGKLQRVEATVGHVSEQIKEMRTDLGYALDRLREAVASGDRMQGLAVPTQRSVSEEGQREKKP